MPHAICNRTDIYKGNTICIMQCAAVLSKNELEVEVGKKLGTAVSTEGTKDGIFFSGG